MTFIGFLLAIGVSLAACTASEREPVGPLAASQANPLTVADVHANRESLLGQTVRVRGQVHIQQYFSRRPCNEATGEGCDPSMGSVVQLITPGQAAVGDNAIDVYRAKPGGAEYEPLACKPSAAGALECGGFVAGTVVVVTGELRKQRLVTGRIIRPDGTSTTTEFRDMYFLAVAQ